jgi:chromosome segregation ATPase
MRRFNICKIQKHTFMNYVLETISTVQACDALLAGAKKKKQNIERRVRNLGESLATFRKRLDQVHQESAQLLSTLEAFTDAYGSLPDGKDKVNMKIRIKRLELQQAMLEKKATIYNVGALLVKEMQYNRLHSQVGVLENYITAVEQQRAALEGPALRVLQPAVLSRRPVARPGLTPQVLRLPEVGTARREHLNLFFHHFRAGLSYHFSVA